MPKEILTLIKEDLTFNDILLETSLTKLELLSFYNHFLYDSTISLDLKKIIKEEYLENVFFTNLKNDKAILISDTHIGSKKENINYLNQVKFFIQENNISYLFHGGDIADGMVNYHQKYNTYEKQIDHLLDIYLNQFDLKQYIMGGNHDYKYKRKNVDILKLLSNNDLIENIGYYRSYFKVFNKTISFEHNSKKRTDLITPNFRILGHTHECKFKDTSVTLPTSCDENTNNSLIFTPGFITLESNKKENNIELSFSEYAYTENGPEKIKVKKYVLKD